MILLFGASGYVGRAFATELVRRQLPFMPLSRRELDYSRFNVLLKCLRDLRPAFVINAAGYIGKPNVDACENAKAETLLGNSILPLTIAHACAIAEIPWGHVSTGCVYNGAKVRNETGGWRIVPDLNTPELRRLFDTEPGAFRGFNEEDEPNFSFRHPPCSFHNGTKVLAEEAIRDTGRVYIWRLRIPFDEFDSPRNSLSKLQRYPKVYDNINSFSHRGDFARACLELWERGAAFGIYNVTNPGAISTRQIIAKIERLLKPARLFEFFADDAQFYSAGVKAPRSNCILDTQKLLAAGVQLRPVHEAFEDALLHWRPEKHEPDATADGRAAKE
jgi:dTDP-4-dehydrorhamnose reductase